MKICKDFDVNKCPVCSRQYKSANDDNCSITSWINYLNKHSIDDVYFKGLVINRLMHYDMTDNVYFLPALKCVNEKYYNWFNTMLLLK